MTQLMNGSPDLPEAAAFAGRRGFSACCDEFFADRTHDIRERERRASERASEESYRDGVCVSSV